MFRLMIFFLYVIRKLFKVVILYYIIKRKYYFSIIVVVVLCFVLGFRLIKIVVYDFITFVGYVIVEDMV